MTTSARPPPDHSHTTNEPEPKAFRINNTVVASETNRPLPRQRNHTHTARLENLRTRLHAWAAPLVPGLTAHQAKGREWDVVGVHLTDAERGSLRRGLSSDSEDHRKLYVALTRAKRTTMDVSG
ncbi:3'-5' exonuclease [Streptomyces sp. NPDC088729]|uniref:3'-5' exonuclease n=1 Tax=Streptomyces sp. NPDC088729 TaxID=3365876 RepID=UPI0038087801